VLIFTDRSRQETENRCKRQRYLQYDSVNGYGITSKAVAVPMMTGLQLHEPLAKVWQTILMGNGAITFPLTEQTRKMIRVFIADAIKTYIQSVKDGGFVASVEFPDYQTTLREQCALVEGLTWGWVRHMLPWVLESHEIIAAEQEESYMLGCTCGIGDGKGEIEEHQAKDCDGIVQQSRPDFVMRRIVDKEVGIHDFKSTSAVYDGDIERYRNSVQMGVGTVGVERRLGIPVTHYYIHFLLKGSWKRQYSGRVDGVNKYEGPKQQQSDFCYVDYAPANPPLQREVVQFSGPWYKRTPVWQIDTWQDKPPQYQVGEWLVELMPEEVLAKQFVLLGPYDRQTHLIRGHLTQVKHREWDWTEKLWRVHDRQAEGATLEEALDENFPQSWACQQFGDTCPMYKICTKDGVSLTNPLASGLYKLRVPHHVPELDAMKENAKAHGIELPEELKMKPKVAPKPEPKAGPRAVVRAKRA